MPEGKKYNWLSDNIVSIIAISVILFAFTVFLLILLREVRTTESTTITILSLIGNVLLIVLNYFFGSTKSSKDKDKLLAEMQAVPETLPSHEKLLSMIENSTSVEELNKYKKFILTLDEKQAFEQKLKTF